MTLLNFGAQDLPSPDALVDEILCNVANRGVCYLLKSKHMTSEGSVGYMLES